MKIMAILMIASSLALPSKIIRAGEGGKSVTGPTKGNALAAEEEINHALLRNDADALQRLLADEWIVVSAFGAIAERGPFIDAIKSGQFTRKTMDLSDPRVKIYGDMAVITSRLKTSGTIGGRNFDVVERQTDVLIWKDGAWKSVLLHETIIRE